MWSNLDDEVFPQDVLFFSLELLQTAVGIVRNVSSEMILQEIPWRILLQGSGKWYTLDFLVDY